MQEQASEPSRVRKTKQRRRMLVQPDVGKSVDAMQDSHDLGRCSRNKQMGLAVARSLQPARTHRP